jgi:hypothetical protein
MNGELSGIGGASRHRFHLLLNFAKIIILIITIFVGELHTVIQTAKDRIFHF